MEKRSLKDIDAKGCVFCSIINGKGDAHVVYEDGLTIAFLDRRPLLGGHCLLIPKRHHETFLDLPEDLTAPLFNNARLLTRAVMTGLKAHGCFVAMNNIISQGVPHIHIHIVPRWRNDGLFSEGFFWKRRPYKSDEEARRVKDAIREAVSGIMAGKGKGAG